jgi:predicted nuclease of predicted toxin-antitoxin system
MRFLADMGVDVHVVQWLNENGHDALHLRDQGLHRLSNGQIFTKAADERRILLTFDLDFGEIAALTHRHQVTVLLFRLHNTRAPHIIARLDAVMTTSPSALARPAVVLVEESRHRIRYLPIGGTAA